MAFADLRATSNAEFWKAARDADTTFASHTSEATSALFTEQGYESITRSDIGTLNQFLGLSVRTAFQKLRAARARNPLEDKGLIEVYDNPYGRYIQRITVNGIKPVSPAYKGLQDFDTVDPWVVKKTTAEERFYGPNFDYQALITVQDYQVKEIFLAEYGVGEYIASLMTALDNAYLLQRYENSLECINASLNSTGTPLKSTQIAELPTWTDGAPTAADLTALITYLKDISTGLAVTAQTGAYNAAGFKTVTDPSDCVLLMRAGVKNRIATQLMVGAFNPDQLSLPFEVIEVESFGGLRPTVASSGNTAYPVYDRLGSMIGYATTQDAETPNLTDDEVTYLDPNEDVIAIVAQKGAYFETIQNAYTVRTIYNPRGLYENYWASAPNNSVKYDPTYTLIAIRKPST